MLFVAGLRSAIQHTAHGYCDKCDKKRPAASKLTMDLTITQREKSQLDLMSIQETKFALRPVVPRKLCTLWSDLLTDVALGMADATKESEVRKALRRYLMLKAVLVKPVRGGGGHRNRNINLTEKLMTWFWQGREDEVWQTSLEIEKRRCAKRIRRKKGQAKRNLEGDLIKRMGSREELKIYTAKLLYSHQMEIISRKGA